MIGFINFAVGGLKAQLRRSIGGVISWALSDKEFYLEDFRSKSGRVHDMRFGLHTVNIDGANNKINFNVTATFSAAGDLGYNTSLNQLQWHNGTAAQTVPNQAAVMLLDGTQAMTGNMALGGNKITGLGTPTTSTDAATAGYVDTRVAPAAQAGGAGAGFVGFALVTEINALSPLTGDVVVAEDAGTPSAGTSDLLAAGDVAEFDGTSWLVIVPNSGGFPPSGTRLIVATTTGFVDSPNNGVTTGQDEGKIAIFDGTSLAPASFFTPSDGNLQVIIDDDSVNDGRVFSFNGVVPTGAWEQSSGVGADHGQLSAASLLDDDHTQYVLLAGRAGGQTLYGGTAASEIMQINSTQNATKGSVRLGNLGVVVDEANTRVGFGVVPTNKFDLATVTGGEAMRVGSGGSVGNIIPETTNNGQVGTTTNKWSAVVATTGTFEDTNMYNRDRDTLLTLWESEDASGSAELFVTNRKDGQTYRVPLEAVQTPAGYVPSDGRPIAFGGFAYLDAESAVEKAQQQIRTVEGLIRTAEVEAIVIVNKLKSIEFADQHPALTVELVAKRNQLVALKDQLFTAEEKAEAAVDAFNTLTAKALAAK